MISIRRVSDDNFLSSVHFGFGGVLYDPDFKPDPEDALLFHVQTDALDILSDCEKLFPEEKFVLDYYHDFQITD